MGLGFIQIRTKSWFVKPLKSSLEKNGEFIDKIPKNVKIIIMPGNHDPGRRALPQPAIPKKYNSGLWDRENVMMVGNPAVVSLNGVKGDDVSRTKY